MKTLVLFAHPRMDRSEVGHPLFSAVKAIPGITAVDLYGEYPDFAIDVDREQERLLQHDAIVLQHPLYWYSVPSLMKEWMDLVFEHNFAYGQKGHALDNKVIFNATTAGAKRDAYTPEGANGAELRDLLLPFQKSAELCRMRYLAPFAIFSAGHAIEDNTLDTYVAAYVRLLTALAEDRIDILKAQRVKTLSDDLDAVIRDKA